MTATSTLFASTLLLAIACVALALGHLQRDRREKRWTESLGNLFVRGQASQDAMMREVRGILSDILGPVPERKDETLASPTTQREAPRETTRADYRDEPPLNAVPFETDPTDATLPRAREVVDILDPDALDPFGVPGLRVDPFARVGATVY